MATSPRKKIYHWHPELPSWRYETIEEQMEREGVKKSEAELYIAINEK